ncbi:S1 family peptidase [Vibrio sonorensis]|uniref:S1 family peptidase n=1 Tax=Vibrio sonorensis TaxID=1004316 RepID=UPI0008DA50CF|nr:serine protease [Vibrio sonorensis]
MIKTRVSYLFQLLLFLLLLSPISISSSNASPRIISGKPVEKNEWPFLVALVKKGQPAFEGQFCGGTIIDEWRILTAAHCVHGINPEDLEVVVGVNDLSKETTQGTRYGVDNIINEDFFDYSAKDYDMAIVELSRKLIGSDFQPVSLARNLPRGGTEDGAPLLIAGWGATDAENALQSSPFKLHQAELNLMSQSECRSFVSSNPLIGALIRDSNLCAKAVDSQNACQGDSGGPLVRKDTGEQIGVLSWTLADCKSLSVYSDVSYFNAWIRSVQNGLSQTSIKYLGVTSESNPTHTLTYVNKTSFPITIKGIAGAPYKYNMENTTVDSISGCANPTLAPGDACDISVRLSQIRNGLTGFYIETEYEVNGVQASLFTERYYHKYQPSALDLTTVIPFSSFGAYTNGNEWQLEGEKLVSSVLVGNSQFIIGELSKGYIAFSVETEGLEAGDTINYTANNTTFDKVGNVALALENTSNYLTFQFNKQSATSLGKVTLSNFRSLSKAEYEAIPEQHLQVKKQPMLSDVLTEGETIGSGKPSEENNGSQDNEPEVIVDNQNSALQHSDSGGGGGTSSSILLFVMGCLLFRRTFSPSLVDFPLVCR